MEVVVAHELTPETVAERVRVAAERADVLVEARELGGSVAKDTPLGSVRATYTVRTGDVLVVVEQRPAWLPEDTVRRMIEEGLRSALGDG
jgi:hypothetical protein